jgi:uncharacterized membrane protein (UPF0136 family)
MSHHLAATFGAICSIKLILGTIGGVAGFVKSNSKPSLAGGLVIGGMYFTSAYLIKENKENGMQVALITSLLLTGAMAKRALIVRAPIPVTMFSVGLLSTAYYGLKFKQEIFGV